METDAIVARLTGIYAILNEGPADPVALGAQVLAGGVRILQYRAKSGLVPNHARALRRLTREHHALLILNDDWRAVEPFEADGVHIGPEDAAPEQLADIRAAMDGRILGISCGTAQEANAAQWAGADYIGAGCVFATQSKADAGEPIGIPGLRRIAEATPLPVAAIGGITAENLWEVRRTGVAMAAVISAISAGADPLAAASALVWAWNE